MICIYRTDNSMRAHLIVSQLESAGITTFVKSNDASGTMPHLHAVNPIEIFIHEDDQKLAMSLLTSE